MSQIERQMMRCASCTMWRSIGPDDELACPSCGGPMQPVDMKAHIAALPDATKVVHNHLSKERRARGMCEACDAEYLTEDKARAEAAKLAKGSTT